MENMNRLKWSVILLALLLAAIAMTPMVSAEEKDPARLADEAKIKELFKPINEDIHLLVTEKSLESDQAKTAEYSKSVSEVLKKYDGDMDNIILLLDKITNIHLDDANRTLLKDVIVTEQFKRVSDDAVLEKRGLRKEDAIIIKPKILGFMNHSYDLNRIQTESLKADTFILAQSGPDVYGGIGTDNAGLPYAVDGGNNLYQVMTWQSNPVTYRLCYYDEDHPYPDLNTQYDALRIIATGSLLDYAQFEVSDTDIHYSLSWSSSLTYAFPAGNHGSVNRPKSSVMYVANIWNHDISTTNTNPNMGQLVMSVPYIPQ
jgi:hypothetical protein